MRGDKSYIVLSSASIMVTKTWDSGPTGRDVRMVGQKMKASGTRSDLPQAMVDLAQGNEPAVGGGDSGADAVEIELALADLVADANGEVVIFNDSGFRTLAIRTRATVVGEGQAPKHVTATGEDVSGFKYVTFDNGVTLYFPEGLDLILKGAPSRPSP